MSGGGMRLARDPDRAGVLHATGAAEGPRVVLFGGTHGDEVSGVHAIEKLWFDLSAGARTLRRGKLALVRVNEPAIAAGRRYLALNVNRLFRDDYPAGIDRACHEFRRVQELKPLLQQCDYFLDLHSAPIAQEPFLVAEAHAAPFYARLGLERIITGWGRFSGGPLGGDAENYANRFGAKADTLESGSHFEQRSNDVAYATAVALLALLGMIDGDVPSAGRAEIVDMYRVVTKEADDFRYEGEVANFKPLARGEVFARQGGAALAVEEDSVLLIPMQPAETKVGEEVCYLGRRVAAAA